MSLLIMLCNAPLELYSRTTCSGCRFQAYLNLHICTNHIQLLASFCLEEVQKVRDSGQEDAATDSDSLCQLSLLNLQEAAQGLHHFLRLHHRHEINFDCDVPHSTQEAE